MAEALDPETTSALQAGKEIELATINKGLNWARVILGTPGGAALIDCGFDWLQGAHPGEGVGDWGEGAIVMSNIGHRVKDGGRDGRSGGGSGATEDLSDVGGSGGATETGVNDSPIKCAKDV